METMTKYPYKVIDRYGCGKIAFYLKVDIRGLLMKAEHFVLPDGTKPRNGEVIRCGSCGKTMSIWIPEENE